MRFLYFSVFTLLALSPVAMGQTTSGSVRGSVADQNGGLVVGAAVTLTSSVSHQARQFLTDTQGNFFFEDVPPGGYSVKVEHPGFKTHLDDNVTVASQERVALHEIRLSVGDVTTTVEVAAEVAHVQTDTSDKTITINTTQIQDTPTAGRNFLNILRSLPGTTQTSTTDARGGTGANAGGGAPTVNGGAGQLLVTLDGIASQDSGAPGTGGYQAPSADAIGEVQLMVSDYTAEYGARNGGQMNVTIKNGTNQFHGTAYYYWRHEMLDSNEWFNNKNTVTINGIPGQANPKPLYRYQNPGGTIGGPLIIPGTSFNKNRDKVFFFFSADYLYHKGTNGPNHYTMPTALERSGDFSQTTTTAGVLIPILDPTTGQPFANNKIPSSRISGLGSAMLNMLPMPNGEDPSGQRAYNYTQSWTQSDPVQDKILRIDYNLDKKTTVYVRGLQDYYAVEGVGSLLQPTGGGWGQFLSQYGVPNVGVVANVIHTFRPNLINEFIWGINRSHQIVKPIGVNGGGGNALSGGPACSAQSTAPFPYSCDQVGSPLFVATAGPQAGQNMSPALPNFFPNANILNLLPNINFGSGGGFSVQSAGQSVPAAPGYGYDTRWPFSGTDQISSVTENLTWIKGPHTVKGGFYFEYDSRNVTMYNNYNTPGTFYFASDTANPNDTGYPYSNAVLGSAFAYGVDNKTQVNHARYATYELFLQDTWKVNRRLTLDYGLRIQSIGQEYSNGATIGNFETNLYNPNSVGSLLFPALNSAGKKIAVNRTTGAVYPFAQVVTFDPASYPAGQYPWSGVQNFTGKFWNRGTPNLGPRIGFAYDLLGDGKMAVRGGFGIFYGRATSVDQIAANGGGNGLQEVAPNFLSPAYPYPTFTSLAGSQAYYAPQNVYGGTQNILNPQTLQWSIGVQRDVGHGTILDVSYLGWVTHHGFAQTSWDLNTIAPYTTWKPTPGPGTNSCGQVTAFLDPTNANVNSTTCLGGADLNTSLIRSMVKYTGWTSIYISTNAGESNYNAMQVQLNKRFGSRLQFSSNFNWSKQLGYGRSQDLSDYLTYAVNGSNRPFAENINFGYRVPNGTSLLGQSNIAKNPVLRGMFDGWNINGVVAIFSGTPFNVGCSATNTPVGYWYGTPVDTPGLRCEQSGSLWLPAGSTPASVGSVASPRLWWPLNGGPSVPNGTGSFSLPPANSFGLGNEPLIMTYGPGFENFDLSVYKDFYLGKETRVLEFRAEAFNTFNHFNPSNPSSGLTYNWQTGAETSSGFGTITGVQNSARHMALSLRLRF